MKTSLYGQFVFNKWEAAVNGVNIASFTNDVSMWAYLESQVTKTETVSPTCTLEKNEFKVHESLKYNTIFQL